MSVLKILNAAAIRRLAGPRSFERGVGYLNDGRVERPVERDGRLRALVRGTVPYVAELWATQGQPRWECTCPAAEDGSFCKHCVAVALAALPEHEDSGEQSRSRLARASDTPRQKTSSGRTAAPKISNWVRRIDRAFFSYGDFVSYHEAEDWADGIGVMIEGLENLCDAGHPDAVAELAEHAFACADEAMNYVDDSDGHLGWIIERLSEVHLRASREGTAKPAELAGRLVGMVLKSELDGFHRAAARYAGVLGPEGIAEYRRLLEPRLRKIKPTDDPYGTAFTIRQALVGWALATGDPDALIKAHSSGGQQPNTQDVLEIASALNDAGRVDEAVSWARHGISETATHPRAGDDLRGFLAHLLQERGDPSGAVELFWQAFVADPSVGRYRDLGDKSPSTAWLKRCTEHLRTTLQRSPSPPGSALRPSAARVQAAPPGRTSLPIANPTSPAAAALVEILLFEGQATEAWEAAVEFGCPSALRLTLARVREQSHPLDAITIYETETRAIIDRKQPNRYRDAVNLMERIHRLANAAGEPERFAAFLQHVRTEHKLKRRLMAELSEGDWSR